MKKIIIRLSVFVLLSATQSFAADGKSGGGGRFTLGPSTNEWIGVGGGNFSVAKPLHQVDADSSMYAALGADFRLLGSLYLVPSASGTLTSGKLQYDFTSPTNVHYTVSDLNFNSSAVYFDLALVQRLVDSNTLHVGIGGGGFYGTTSINLDTTLATKLTQQGVLTTDYSRSASNVPVNGYYGIFTLDYLFGKMGLRFAARAGRSSSGKVSVLANEKMSSSEVYGYLAVLFHQ